MSAPQWLISILILPTIWAMVSYDGYKAFRITVKDDGQYEFLKSFVESSGRFDVWKEARRPGDHMDVMVQPDDVHYFTTSLRHRSIDFDTMMDDVGSVLTASKETRDAKSPEIYYDFTQYHTLAEIEGYLNELQSNFSSQVSLFTVGTSYEGRTITGAKISSGGSGKPAVWVDSCIHSREWAACATTQYFIYKLLNSYGSDPVVADLLDNIDIYYVPVVNVDGYEHTWTSDRLWRKTRSPNAGSACVGTDPNRNWDFFWCDQGSSTSPCSDAYCGRAPFSESEVSGTASYVQTIPNLQLFMSFHCYGQWYMTPWAHYVATPPNYADQMAACNRAINALMDTNGNTVIFECGTIQSFVGRTSGSSVDWVYENIDTVNYAIGTELRDQGRYGFELPPEQIIPSGEENYSAMLEMLATIRNENP